MVTPLYCVVLGVVVHASTDFMVHQQVSARRAPHFARWYVTSTGMFCVLVSTECWSFKSSVKHTQLPTLQR